MNKKILVRIKKDGSLEIETNGFKGTTCVNELRKLLSDFVDIDLNIKTTSDYYEDEENIDTQVDINL